MIQRLALLPLILIVGSSLVSRHVLARSPDLKKDVARLYEEGRDHFEAGKYREAIEAFEKANSLYPNKILIYNVARAYELMCKPDEAIRMYRRYLEAGAAPDANVVEDKITLLERLKGKCEKTAFLSVRTVPSGASVLVDGVNSGITPLKRHELAPGEHQIVVRKLGMKDVSQRISLSSGEKRTLMLGFSPADRPAGAWRIVSFTGIGLASACLAAGLWTGVLALDAEKEYNEHPNDPDRDDMRSRGRSLALSSDILVGTGAALMVAGILLLVTSPDEKDGTERTITWGTSVDHHGVGFRAAWRF